MRTQGYARCAASQEHTWEAHPNQLASPAELAVWKCRAGRHSHKSCERRTLYSAIFCGMSRRFFRMSCCLRNHGSTSAGEKFVLVQEQLSALLPTTVGVMKPCLHQPDYCFTFVLVTLRLPPLGRIGGGDVVADPRAADLRA